MFIALILFMCTNFDIFFAFDKKCILSFDIKKNPFFTPLFSIKNNIVTNTENKSIITQKQMEDKNKTNDTFIKKQCLCNTYEVKRSESINKENDSPIDKIVPNSCLIGKNINNADLIDIELLNKEKLMELKIKNRQLYDYYVFMHNDVNM